MKKGKIEIERDGNLLRIGNKWYRWIINEDGDFRTGTHILEEVDIKKRNREINAISESLFKVVNPKLVLKDALKDMAEEELSKLHKFVKKNKDAYKKAKITKHCVAMDVGGVHVPIRE